jgi:hypothetical protein
MLVLHVSLTLTQRADYCRRRNISYHALTYWQRKLKQSSTSLTLIPVSLPAKINFGTSHSEQVALKILLPGEIAIAVGDSFSGATLNRLLALLESR